MLPQVALRSGSSRLLHSYLDPPLEKISDFSSAADVEYCTTPTWTPSQEEGEGLWYGSLDFERFKRDLLSEARSAGCVGARVRPRLCLLFSLSASFAV
jgi:hypothetical protein